MYHMEGLEEEATVLFLSVILLGRWVEEEEGVRFSLTVSISSLQEVGEELGISRDMVRALEKRAIRRLRQELRRASQP